MELNYYNWVKEEIGTVSLRDDIFGLEFISPEIIKQVIDWQLAKRRVGSHKTKTISEVSGTTKKPFKQKGTGNARQGSLRSPHMRGGSVMHGPVIRVHAIGLQKKVRQLGLKYALSSKVMDKKLTIVDGFEFFSTPKTSALVKVLHNFEVRKVLIVGSDDDNDHENVNIKLACRNIPNALFIPAVGLNVYDIIKYESIILSLGALQSLEARL